MIDLAYSPSQIVIETSITLVIVYCGYKAFWEFVVYDVDYDELDQSGEDCPRCKKELYVEYGKYSNMYRCKNCRFEGMREPLVYGIRQACSKRYNQIKERINNVR